MKSTLKKLYDKVLCGAFSIMLLFIALGIIIGVVRLFFNLGNLLVNEDITRQYVRIISEVLTLFILIELSRSLTDYFSEHRLRMTFIVDAGIVFVLREIMIKLFEHQIAPGEIYCPLLPAVRAGLPAHWLGAVVPAGKADAGRCGTGRSSGLLSRFRPQGVDRHRQGRQDQDDHRAKAQGEPQPVTYRAQQVSRRRSPLAHVG